MSFQNSDFEFKINFVPLKTIRDVRVADKTAAGRRNIMFSAGGWGTTSSAAFRIPASLGAMLFLCELPHVTSLLGEILLALVLV